MTTIFKKCYHYGINMIGKKLSLILGVLALSLLLVGVVNACSCPLDEEDYNQVIEINQWLVSDHATYSSSLGRYYEISSGVIDLDYELVAGEYEITLVSRDYYPTRESTNSATQQNETYYIKFIDGYSFVEETNSTSDLEDGVNPDENIEIVETNLFLPSGTDSLQAFHSAYQTPSGIRNSLEAVCVGINLVKKYSVCGDDFLDTDEECDGESNCTDECKWEEEPEPKQYGFGNVLDYSECLPDWECSGWSDCSNGVMTRTCSDANYCEISYNEPHTTTDCLEPVIKELKVVNPNLGLFFAGIVLLIILLIVLINLRS